MKIFFVILFIGIASSSVHAQGFVSDVSKKGTTAAPFLSIGQGARAIGMGSAFVAIADDRSSLYWNPAGLADLPGNGIVFDHTQWIADLQYNFFGASFNLGDYGAVGMSAITSSISDMDVTTISEPDGTGEVFGVSDAAFSLAYALKLTNEFSIGINPKYVYQKIWKMSAGTFAFDLGVKYKTPFPGITLAMTITNFGGKMQMAGPNALITYDPDLPNSGNNDRIPANLQMDEWALPLNFRVGIAYDAIKSDDNRLVFAIDATHPNDNYESLNVGGEYTYQDFLSLRSGYKALFLQSSEESFAFGVGVKQFVVRNVVVSIDYAYQEFKRLKNIQKFSVGINF
ncbi:MAG: PorV/PorQ family protein [Bacteroidota bacterium]|nr:PorV/PorQ family protein [Bacteroidota bacterium]